MKMTDAATLTGARVINQAGKVLQHLTDLNQMTLYGGSKMAKKTLDELLCGEKRFGLYTVIGEGRQDDKNRFAKCECDCGSVKDVAVSRLSSGRSTRCKECAAVSSARITNLTHGMTGTPEYKAWSSMRGRCRNASYENYPAYGGRGITVCPEWDVSFESFVSDMGLRPKGHSLDRIDNDGNYEPSNCRWAVPKDQSGNRRVTIFVTWQGKRVTTSQLERKYGFCKGVVAARIGMGWSVERAVSEPALQNKPVHQVFGESMSTKQIVDRFKISKQAFNYRIRVMKLTAEQAIHALTISEREANAN